MGALLIAQADVNPYDLDNDSYIVVCKVKIAESVMLLFYKMQKSQVILCYRLIFIFREILNANII